MACDLKRRTPNAGQVSSPVARARQGGGARRRLALACPALVMALALLPADLRAEEEVVIKEKPLSQWIKQLQSENRGLQLRAYRALCEATPAQIPTVIPLVLPLLAADRENSRLPCAQLMGEYGPPVPPCRNWWNCSKAPSSSAIARPRPRPWARS